MSNKDVDDIIELVERIGVDGITVPKGFTFRLDTERMTKIEEWANKTDGFLDWYSKQTPGSVDEKYLMTEVMSELDVNAIEIAVTLGRLVNDPVPDENDHPRIAKAAYILHVMGQDVNGFFLPADDNNNTVVN